MGDAGCAKCDAKAKCREEKQIECHICCKPCPMDDVVCSCLKNKTAGHGLSYGSYSTGHDVMTYLRQGCL